ncbi:DUF473 domain-containing protein [Thermococcus celer]|uniref:DUF473 domain-containing protein n=1 Tax=Thermococcus celer Vu 13 = JCM 8558 TaxID=1293037 RepID=A0A218P385_THECE|nr:DUF473 domain-containing protein [Thermococcus celer]ASI99390.1 hypothetical protein A3L02_07385 [Thermococcus celer Vu 13 = JCM 8558]
MEAIILAGIARRVLDELLKNPYKTIEIRGARNVVALERARELGRVFLTYETYQDIAPGTEGLLAELLKLDSMEQRIPWKESDEREITVCRAQIRLLGLGRVVKVRERNTVLMVEVREMMPHEMDMG